MLLLHIHTLVTVVTFRVHTHTHSIYVSRTKVSCAHLSNTPLFLLASRPLANLPSRYPYSDLTNFGVEDIVKADMHLQVHSHSHASHTQR